MQFNRGSSIILRSVNFGVGRIWAGWGWEFVNGQKHKQMKLETIYKHSEKEQRHYINLIPLESQVNAKKRRRCTMDKQPRWGVSNHHLRLVLRSDTCDSWQYINASILREPTCGWIYCFCWRLDDLDCLETNFASGNCWTGLIIHRELVNLVCISLPCWLPQSCLSMQGEEAKVIYRWRHPAVKKTSVSYEGVFGQWVTWRTTIFWP